MYIYMYTNLRTHGMFLQPFSVLHTMPTLPLLAQFITLCCIALQLIAQENPAVHSYSLAYIVDATRIKHPTIHMLII